MRRSALIVLVTLAILAVGCDDSRSSAKGVSTTPQTVTEATKSTASSDSVEVEVDARVAFPDKLAAYKFASWKTKKKDWGTAYSATYKDANKDELKVVVNDAPPAGRVEWAVFFKGESFKNKPMAIDAKADKVTMMVRVGDRFRVDFKTRTGNADLLKKVANDFDFGTVRKLAQ